MDTTTAPRSRTYNWLDPALVAAKIGRVSGLEYLQMVVRGEIRAPIQDTLGFSLDHVEEGLSRWTLQVEEFHYNPAGTLHGGVMATLLDSATSVAIWTTLPAGVAWTSIELKSTYVRPATKATGKLTCEGKALNVGRRMGLAEARLFDADGKLYAHGVSTCMIDRPKS